MLKFVHITYSNHVIDCTLIDNILITNKSLRRKLRKVDVLQCSDKRGPCGNKT